MYDDLSRNKFSFFFPSPDSTHRNGNDEGEGLPNRNLFQFDQIKLHVLLLGFHLEEMWGTRTAGATDGIYKLESFRTWSFLHKNWDGKRRNKKVYPTQLFPRLFFSKSGIGHTIVKEIGTVTNFLKQKSKNDHHQSSAQGWRFISDFSHSLQFRVKGLERD